MEPDTSSTITPRGTDRLNDTAITAEESELSTGATEPLEITAEVWHGALNAQPPVGWSNAAFGESFKVTASAADVIARIYVRINERHFCFEGDVRLPHATCCRQVAQAKAYREPSNARAGVATYTPSAWARQDEGSRR